MTATVLESKKSGGIGDFAINLIRVPLKFSSQIATLSIFSLIVLPPLHNALESAYTGVNAINRVKAWIPSSKPVAGLSKEQSDNVKAIIKQGKAQDMSDRDIKLALMTAYQESGMKRLNHGDDWYFAQTGGGTSDSRGLFQQRDSWGSKSCRMNASCSAKLFYNALSQVPDRGSLPDWKAIATVQRPAKQYEVEYQKWRDEAQQAMKQAGELKISESVKLPSIEKVDRFNWFNNKDAEIRVDSRPGKYLMMSLTSRYRGNAKVYKVAAIDNGKVVKSFDSVSGLAGSNNQNSHIMGSGDPLPNGEYALGNPEVGRFANYQALGNTWISMSPKFKTNRSAIGIHLDANNDGQTMGCLGLTSQKDTEEVAALVRQGYTNLVKK